MSKVGVKIPPTTSEEKIPIDNNNSAGGLNGLVNGEHSKKLASRNSKKSENHRKEVSSSKSEVVAGTKPKKKNRKQKNEDKVEELTKLDLCSIINGGREPVASSSRGVNTETLIDDLKDLNIDTDLINEIGCNETVENFTPTTTVQVQEVEEQMKELPPVDYVQYESELQMPMIMKLIQKDLSEPYSIYTYRYFIHNWPKLCFLVCLFICF